MYLRHLVSASLFVVVAFAGLSWSTAQSPPESQIYWVQSPQMATSLARQFHLPIVVFVTSDSCYYCRKMEQEVWNNADVIAMVEDGFVPLQLHAERDAELIAALQIRAFPTTLLFSSDARPIHSVTGYQSASQIAALLRNQPPLDAIRPDSASAEDPPSHQIQWQHSAKTAATLARQSQRPILMYVSSNNCGNCRKMEQEVWGDAEIISIVESGFVPLELNAERDAELVRSLRVQGFPTTIVFSADAKYITSAAGYLPPNQLVALLRQGQPPAPRHFTQNK